MGPVLSLSKDHGKRSNSLPGQASRTVSIAVAREGAHIAVFARIASATPVSNSYRMEHMEQGPMEVIPFASHDLLVASGLQAESNGFHAIV